MKANSTIMPERVSDELLLRENITEVVKEGETTYQYDEYKLETPLSKAEVEADFDRLLLVAKAQETDRRDLEYKNATQNFIKERYTESDELKLLNGAVIAVVGAEPLSNEYVAYRLYVEACKLRALELTQD